MNNLKESVLSLYEIYLNESMLDKIRVINPKTGNSIKAKSAMQYKDEDLKQKVRDTVQKLKDKEAAGEKIGDEPIEIEHDLPTKDEEPTKDGESTSDKEEGDDESTDGESGDGESTDEEPTDEEPTDEEPTDEEPTDEEPTDEEPTDEEPVEDKPTDKKEIEKLSDEISNLEDKIENTKDAREQQIEELKKKTDLIIGTNKILKKYATKMRLQSNIDFNEEVIKMIGGTEKEDEVKSKIVKLKKAEASVDKDIESAYKKVEDEPKIQDAVKKIEDEPKSEPDAETESDPGKEQDQYILDKAKEKLTALEDAVELKKEELDKADSEDGKDALKTQIEDIEADKEKMKEYVQSLEDKLAENTQSDYWTLNLMLNLIETKLSNINGKSRIL